jgi:hypothetical protein
MTSETARGRRRHPSQYKSNTEKRAYGLQHGSQHPDLARFLLNEVREKRIRRAEIFNLSSFQAVLLATTRSGVFAPTTFIESPDLANGGLNAWRGTLAELVASHGDELREVVCERLAVEEPLDDAMLMRLVIRDDLANVLGDDLLI